MTTLDGGDGDGGGGGAMASTMAPSIANRGPFSASSQASPALCTVAFEDAFVKVDNLNTAQRVPVALWYPTSAAANSGAASVTYPHTISVAKIARVLLNTSPDTPRWFDRDIPLSAAPGVIAAPAASAARGGAAPRPGDADYPPIVPRGAVILCHGYLGSRFDLVDMAESLAAAGFLVVSPEFAESLSSPDTTPAFARPGAPPPVNPSASRDRIVSTVLSEIVSKRFGIDIVGGGGGDGGGGGVKVALVGQSAGAATATSTVGRFARVAIAGFRIPTLEVGSSFETALVYRP